MGPFLEHAAEILNVARHAASAGHHPQNLHILVGPSGHIRLIADPDPGWSPERLREHHGAHAAYTVDATEAAITVEAATRTTTCRLTEKHPGRIPHPAAFNHLPRQQSFLQIPASH